MVLLRDLIFVHYTVEANILLGIRHFRYTAGADAANDISPVLVVTKQLYTPKNLTYLPTYVTVVTVVTVVIVVTVMTVVTVVTVVTVMTIETVVTVVTGKKNFHKKIFFHKKKLPTKIFTKKLQ